MPPEIRCGKCGETFYEMEVDDWKEARVQAYLSGPFERMIPKCAHCGSWREDKPILRSTSVGVG